MRFVDCKKRYLERIEKIEHRRHKQPLGCYIEQIHFAAPQRGAHARGLLRRLRRIEVRSTNAHFFERIDLVLHERNER